MRLSECTYDLPPHKISMASGSTSTKRHCVRGARGGLHHKQHTSFHRADTSPNAGAAVSRPCRPDCRAHWRQISRLFLPHQRRSAIVAGVWRECTTYDGAPIRLLPPPRLPTTKPQSCWQIVVDFVEALEPSREDVGVNHDCVR